MVATEQHFRNFHSIYFFWLGILWIFEILHILLYTIAFVLPANLFFDDSRDESGYCFDHDHSWSFSSERDELSERNFLEVFLIFFFHILFETIVYAFVSGANENNIFDSAQAVSGLLCKGVFGWTW